MIKKQRDLTAGEIVAQIMLVQKYFDDRGDGERVSHVVVMGIGEPFDNYDNVLRFLRTINNDNGLAIGARHITVSTSGLAPKIKEFANEGVQVNLAVSLHAPNNDLRSSIMRINRSFPLEKLFEAIEYYIQTTNRRVTFEYIMLNEVNDHPENAQVLADLTKKIRKLSYIIAVQLKNVWLPFTMCSRKMVSTVSFVKNMVQILMLLVDNCAQTL